MVVFSVSIKVRSGMVIEDFIGLDEVEKLSQKDDVRAILMLLANWAVIGLAFCFVAIWPGFTSIIVASIILGGRQLGLSVLMHECSHGSFFRSSKANDLVGNWLISYPLLLNLRAYRRVHLKHHKYAGTSDDPDLANYKAYPISRISLFRKFIRDLTGQTVLRQLRAIGPEQAGSLVAGSADPKMLLRNSALAQFILIVPLWATGHLWLYLLWPLAFATTYMLFLRIRQVAEHAAVPDMLDLDPRKNTRTTHAGFWARLTVAPNFVNFHCDHHVLSGIPAYNLRAFHQKLLHRGFYRDQPPFENYTAVLRHVVSA
jgi:fatty acid desaturase